MPKIISESAIVRQKVGPENMEEGSESIVFLDQEDKIAHAFYKAYAEDEFRKQISPDRLLERIKKVKQAFYVQKILNALYPETFPSWHAAGVNSAGEIGSVRELVKGQPTQAKYVPDDKRIRVIKEKLRVKKIFMFEDFLGLNYIKTPEEFYKYIDEVNVEIRSSEDLSRLVEFCEEEFRSRTDLSELVWKIETYCRRILEIQKQQLVIKEGKIVLKK